MQKPPDWNIRCAAVKALGLLGDACALEPLRALLTDIVLAPLATQAIAQLESLG